MHEQSCDFDSSLWRVFASHLLKIWHITPQLRAMAAHYCVAVSSTCEHQRMEKNGLQFKEFNHRCACNACNMVCNAIVTKLHTWKLHGITATTSDISLVEVKNANIERNRLEIGDQDLKTQPTKRLNGWTNIRETMRCSSHFTCAINVYANAPLWSHGRIVERWV